MTWMSTWAPARCLPTLTACHATLTTPTAFTVRVIQSSPCRSCSSADASTVIGTSAANEDANRAAGVTMPMP